MIQRSLPFVQSPERWHSFGLDVRVVRDRVKRTYSAQVCARGALPPTRVGFSTSFKCSAVKSSKKARTAVNEAIGSFVKRRLARRLP